MLNADVVLNSKRERFCNVMIVCVCGVEPVDLMMVMIMFVCRMSETVQLKDVAQPPANNGAVQFGSNVSRLKSRFLQHVSDVTEAASCRRRPVPVHEPSPPPSGTASATAGSHLLDMADHVEKFRNTRALFAQLAEQSAVTQPPPLPRSFQRSFRSTSSASPPPTRSGHVDPARRSVSPSNDLRSSRSLSQTHGRNGSCNGVTTWLQLGSRSLDENSTSQLVSGAAVESSKSDVTSRSLTENFRSTSSWRGGGVVVDPSEVAGVVLRQNNRPNLDLSVGAGRAVLLPKRRSREEKSLMVSKDCLEASLCQADEYWRRQHVEDFSVGDADPLMSESTFSSGSDLNSKVGFVFLLLFSG